MKKSKLFNLDIKDYIKGFVVAVGTTILTGALQLFQTGPIEWTFVFWQPTLYAGIAAGIAYLLKNVFTNSEDKLLTKEP